MIDATNLVHMSGRIYDPELGRFLSPDPNIPEPGNTQAYNRYSYVYNNPLRYTDPSGFVAKDGRPNQYRDAFPISGHSNKDGFDSGSFGVGYVDGNTLLGRGIMPGPKTPRVWNNAISVAIQKAVNTAAIGIDNLDPETMEASLSGGTPDTLVKVPSEVLSSLDITAEEREMLAEGDLEGFWNSRHGRGDPWAIQGLALWDKSHPDLTDTHIAMAALLEAKVYAFMTAELGEALSLDQFAIEFRKIGLEIAYQHMDSVERTGGEVIGLGLSARYHHVAFGKFGLPPTVYGATLVEPAAWNGFWSYEAQAKFVNEHIYQYCNRCPD